MIKKYQPDQLQSEINIIASQLSDDMLKESDFKGLRVAEIDYCLLCGLKGKFESKTSGIKGEVETKTYGLNYQTFYKWLNMYSVCTERTKAYNSIEWDKDKKQLAESCELSPEEQRKIMINGVNMAYQEYLDEAQKRTNSTVEKVIFKIHDFGGARDRFLTISGKKPQNMPLNEFFDKCRREKISDIKQLFINHNEHTVIR